MKAIVPFLLRLYLYCCFQIQLCAQATPPIQAFSPKETSTGNQNWKIDQFDDGSLVFANNQGLATYNGARWKLYPAKDNSIVRSVKAIGKKSFQYGRFEVRAKLAQGQGVWPAFWLLGNNIDQVGWPLCGEIDVLEYVGCAPGEIFTTLHTKAASGDFANTKTTALPNIEEGFHTYAAEWDENQIAFYVDDVNVYTFAPENKIEEIWPFDQPFYLLLNLAIGGHFGGEVDDSIFPQEFIVDYIRVYQ